MSNGDVVNTYLQDFMQPSKTLDSDFACGKVLSKTRSILRLDAVPLAARLPMSKLQISHSWPAMPLSRAGLRSDALSRMAVRSPLLAQSVVKAAGGAGGGRRTGTAQ